MFSAKVAECDAINDVALLKTDGHFAPQPVISSRAVKLAGPVATVGFPGPGLEEKEKWAAMAIAKAAAGRLS